MLEPQWQNKTHHHPTPDVLNHNTDNRIDIEYNSRHRDLRFLSSHSSHSSADTLSVQTRHSSDSGTADGPPTPPLHVHHSEDNSDQALIDESPTQLQFSCSFIPPYLLRTVAACERVDISTREICQATLECFEEASASVRRPNISQTKQIPEARKGMSQNRYSILMNYQDGQAFNFPTIRIKIKQERQNVIKSSEAEIKKTKSRHPAVVPVATFRSTSANRRVYDIRSKFPFPGSIVRTEEIPRVSDRTVNSVFDCFWIVHTFFKQVFGPNSTEKWGREMKAAVHFNTPASNVDINNAFWSTKSKIIILGDGDGQVFDNLAGCLNIYAHQLGHAITEQTAQLEYFGEAGALNESISDVIASMVEQWHLGQTVQEASWLIGQPIFPVLFRGCGLRSLKMPGKAYFNDPILGSDPQPSHYDLRYLGAEDDGGVHINSGIPNHAFYLACQEVGGHSWDKVGQVWYAALMSSMITPACTFAQFRRLTVLEARKWGVEREVANSWTKVGVLSPD